MNVLVLHFYSSTKRELLPILAGELFDHVTRVLGKGGYLPDLPLELPHGAVITSVV
ncbi:hypothetical protein ACODUL_00745 [Stenotrophomonas maltophilia]